MLPLNSKVQNIPFYNEEEDLGLVDLSDIEEKNVFYTDNSNVTCRIYIMCLANSGTTCEELTTNEEFLK